MSATLENGLTSAIAALEEAKPETVVASFYDLFLQVTGMNCEQVTAGLNLVRMMAARGYDEAMEAALIAFGESLRQRAVILTLADPKLETFFDTSFAAFYPHNFAGKGSFVIGVVALSWRGRPFGNVELAAAQS